MRKLNTVVLVATLAAAMSSCSTGYDIGDNTRPEVKHVEPHTGPEDPCATGENVPEHCYGDTEGDAPWGEAVVDPDPRWSCGFSVTYNDDWHDDVVCSNGVESVRPYLREWDDFVTEDEIMESALEYEAQLNGS